MKKAKNIVVFIGDGMSLETLTAARIYKAQQISNHSKDEIFYGEESLLKFEQLPHVGLSKVKVNLYRRTVYRTVYRKVYRVVNRTVYCKQHTRHT